MMIRNSTTLRVAARTLAVLATALLAAAAPSRAAQTSLADQPVFTAVTVPGNVALTLSVEYPTATSIGNGILNYSSTTTYAGYFDSTKCYFYNINTTKTGTTAGSYFTPAALAASDHSCSGASTSYYWSGNFLNWASMSTIDPFRWALTGGYRSIDTASSTILEKAWAPPSQGSATESPPQTTSQTTYPNITPLSNWSNIYTNVFHMGQYMCFTGKSSNVSTTNGTLGSASYTISSTNWSGTLNNATEYNSTATPNSSTTSTVYCVEVRVQVCNASITALGQNSLEGNCTLYPNGNYKPEGLIQKYSQNMRFASFGYLLDSAASGNIGVRDGGVMRSRMEYVGPTSPVPGGVATTNTNAEWNSNTGVFVANPDPTDVTSTTGLTGCSTCSVPNSGTINYVNMFGEHARSLGHSVGYKGYDNVSELYYTALRYYKELGNVHEYTDLTGTNTTLQLSDCVTAGADQCVDGFPVITSWYPTDASAPRGYDYPIQYACQKNFIIGIGDENTHQDANVPGSTQLSDGYEPAQQSAVSSDATLNGNTTINGTAVTSASVTNFIGTAEGAINGYAATTTLGSASWNNYGACCGGATFYIAGLAYDAHVNDLIPNAFVPANGTAKTSIQTLSTFWVDVLEYGTYRPQNQYYLAAKYGGFTVPAGYQEFTTPTANGNAWDTSLWAKNGNTVLQGTTNYTVPDNYYTGRSANAMVSGLQSAFAQIASSISANSTALSLASPKIASSGGVSYTTTYNAADWTGSALATTITFNSAGAIVTTPTTWNAQSALESQSSGTGWNTGRIIVTCCTASGAATPFRQASIGSTYLANLAGTATLQTNVVNYLRGDRTNEGTAGTAAYRVRDYLLGDIVDAQAVPVSYPSAPLSTLSNPGYSSFQSTYRSRKTVVYVGANDGMMHAFDGTIGASTSGQELFAYVPSALYAGPGGGPGTTATPSVNGIVSRTAKTFTHYNFVDATPVVADVDFANGGGHTGTPSWHTMLVGGLGKGGASFYALDVTDPTTWTGETNVATKVLWEFSGTHMGYSYGPAVITKTAQYGWVVILTSGFNNDNGVGYFYFLDPKTGTLLQTVSTSTGTATTPSGLTFASAYVNDYSVGTADALYAGDLLGNVWRVDLTPTTGSYTATNIAQATDSSVVGQPITTRPLIEQAGANGAYRFVIFGTGRTLSSSDLSNSQTNSIYTIYDGRASSGGFNKTAPPVGSFPITRSNLIQETNITTGAAASGQTAALNALGTATPPASDGYYFDLTATAIPGLTPPSTGYAYQVDVQSSANNGIAAFGINVASGLACSPAGIGAILAFHIADTSTGQSALASSYSGAYMTSSRVSDVQFYNNNSTGVGIAAGVASTSDTTPIKQPTCPGCTPAGTITKLNWREIPATN